jgi:hypothetical protein
MVLLLIKGEAAMMIGNQVAINKHYGVDVVTGSRE